MDMILEKLTKIEVAVKYNINSEYRKIETIRGLKELLNQIDFSSEIVPADDSERLTKVLTSLKGKELNRCESQLIEELIAK
jgi:hypothetical protein